MHEPPIFTVKDREALDALIAQNPLALLIAPDDGGFVSVDPVPVAYDPKARVLRAHLARQNPLALRLGRGPQKILALFSGPQAYVSPSFYPSKAVDGRVVPTWNYAFVQAEGLARLIDDEAWLDAQLRALTDNQEQSREKPWAVEDAPADYLARQKAAIIGVEIAISSLRGKFKLSQNRRPEDRDGVIAGLAAEAAPPARALADFMSASRSNRT